MAKRSAEPWSQWWLYPLLAGGVVAIYVLPYLLRAGYFDLLFSLLVREDGVYESAGALACLLAAIILGYTFVAGPTSDAGCGGKRRRNGWLLMWSVLFLLMAGEEISWGQRILGLPTPDWLREINLQNELTLHNLTALQPAIGSNRLQELWILGVVGYFGILPWLSCTVGIVRRGIDALGWPLASLPMAWAHLINSAALVVSNSDHSEQGMTLRIKLGEESFELVAELLFLAFALLVYCRARPLGAAIDRTFWRTVTWVGLGVTAILAWHLMAHELPAARGDALVDQGNRLLNAGDIEGAITRYEDAVRVAPNHMGAHSMLGLIYQRRGEPSAAIEAYERALAVMPDLADAQMNLGLLWLEQENFTQAERHLRSAVELAPHWAEARNNWGVSLVRLGRLTEAVRQFEAALGKNPDDANVLRNLQETRRLLEEP